MSVKVMAMVWQSGLPKNWKMTLLAYADHADDNGESVHPGEEWMAEKTSDSPGNVRRMTAELLDAGYMVRVSRGRRGRRASFRIVLDRLAAQIARHSSALEEAEQLLAAQIARQSEPEIGAQKRPVRRAFSGDRRAKEARKARGGATPIHQEPSIEPSEPFATSPPDGTDGLVDISSTVRERDLVWEVLVEMHGEPATKSERGKLNRVRGQLREADVDDTEYPLLVAAYMAKHTKRGSKAPQPTAMTIAQRVGELRHFLDHGPIGAEPRRLPGTVEKLNRRDCTHENLGVFPSSGDLVEGICPACSKEFNADEVSALLAGTNPNDEAAMADVVS